MYSLEPLNWYMSPDWLQPDWFSTDICYLIACSSQLLKGLSLASDKLWIQRNAAICILSLIASSMSSLLTFIYFLLWSVRFTSFKKPVQCTSYLKNGVHFLYFFGKPNTRFRVEKTEPTLKFPNRLITIIFLTSV